MNKSILSSYSIASSLKSYPYLFFILLLVSNTAISQSENDASLLTIDRIYHSNEFQQERLRPFQWINGGDNYVRIEKSAEYPDADELVIFNSKTQKSEVFVSALDLQIDENFIPIEQFSLSEDGSKVLIFNNSSRVWRSNTKGDYYVYDFTNKSIKKIGQSFEPSTLMFAKFSADNRYVAYVHNFNIYKENYNTGEINQLTFDGTGDIINGTFDWAYEEEFGKRDGFSWSPDTKHIAFWQLDASETGTFYMINNTDSVYSKPIPLQYPKVGEPPSSAKVGALALASHQIVWIPIPGDPKNNYIPGMQWVNKDLLLIQQLNRKQNELRIWTFNVRSKKLNLVYTEVEDTWIELLHPDISSSGWGSNDLPLVDNHSAFLRLTEIDDWRHVYKIDIEKAASTLVTDVNYDVASIARITAEDLYFIASPDNSTQRYLYKTSHKKPGKPIRITPQEYAGVNTYNISPHGIFAVHSHQSTKDPRSFHFIKLPEHSILKTLVDNKSYQDKVAGLALPEIKFTQVQIHDNLDIDVRMVLPPDFDPNKKYPVIFHVYGEPWGQVCTDTQIGLWNIMMAQKGYVIIDMDNRGTPCLKGSEWRKSIYQKIGQLNASDQAAAAKEILKLDYLDADRTAVWGWSGGGSMTLNLMFQYPDIYKTGVSVAAVSNQLIYDNIYQERYMGLPQENMDAFINGSPITYAKNLQGNLLIIHGTGDDNVHYQGTEMLINELIRHNKQFQVMPYPNRSHGIREGSNTSRHLYTLMTNYILTHCPQNEEDVVRP